MKSIVTTFIASVLFSAMYAQIETKQRPQRAQNLYLEGMGNSIVWAVNYDTRFEASDKGAGFSIGAGGLSLAGFSLVNVPVVINHLLGRDGHYLELGAGVNFTYLGNNSELFRVNETTILGTTTFGYRFQPMEGGLMCRLTVNPLFGAPDAQFFFFPFFGGLSLGYTFHR